MGDKIFKKIINSSERKFNFIHIPANEREFLKVPIKIKANGEIFTVTINKTGRMISKKLFEHLNPKIGDTIIMEKDSEEYTMKIEQSHTQPKY